MKSTFFLQKWKISKTVLPNRELACWFWRLVCKWMVQSWGVHRDFRGSARYSLAGRPSSREKHLEIFFTILSLNVLAACPSNLFQLQKLCVLRFEDNFLKLFQFFPRIFVTVTVFPISLSTESNPNTPCHTPQTPFLHHSFSNLQEKCMGFLCLTWFLHVLRIIFLFFGLSLWF